MKGVTLLGMVVLLLGILSFVLPFPHYRHHGVKVRDSRICHHRAR